MRYKEILINIIIVGLIFILASCTETVYDNRPHNDILKSDLKIVSEKNLIGENSILIDLLIDKNINLNELSDLYYSKHNESLFLLFRNGSVVEIKNDQEFEVLIRATGSGPGEMRHAESFKVTEKNIYILDYNLNKILIYDIYGNHEKDVIIAKGVGRSFEVLESGNILILNYSRIDNVLFYVFDESGTVIDNFGKNDFVHQIVDNVDGIPTLKVNKSNNSKDFIISSEATGEAIIFDMSNNTTREEFSIQFGPEWERIYEIEKEAHQNGIYGYFNKINGIDFFSNNDMLVSWGGPISDKITIAMIFDSNGVFKNRIFGTHNIKNMADLISIKNDSTFYMYSWGDDFLGSVQIK